MNQLILVLTTAPTPEDAQRIAQGLLHQRLAACVSILPGAVSHYWWEGQIEAAQEHVLLIKAQEQHLEALTHAIKALHTYSVPEVIALPVLGGNPDYLRWVVESTDQTTGR